jgi:hypothetical protein
MEKRNCTRVLFQSEAILLYKDQTLRGKVENLSLNGMFLRVDDKIPPNEVVEIEILLSGASSKLSVNLQGMVVRQDEDGMAIQLIGMDLDSFVHFKNIITYITGEEREIMNEFHKYVARRNLGI